MMRNTFVACLILVVIGCGGRVDDSNNVKQLSPRSNQLFMEAVGDHYSREAKVIACGKVFPKLQGESQSAWKTYLSIRKEEVNALESRLVKTKGKNSLSKLRAIFLDAEVRKLNDMKIISPEIAIVLCVNGNKSLIKGEILDYYKDFYTELLSIQ